MSPRPKVGGHVPPVTPINSVPDEVTKKKPKTRNIFENEKIKTRPISICERFDSDVQVVLTKQIPAASLHNQHSAVRERQRLVVHVELRQLLQY